jgi:metallopeptidase MepB
MASTFQQPPQALPTFKTEPKAIVLEAKELISGLRTVQIEIVQSVTAEEAVFANVLLPLAQAENVFLAKSKLLTHLESVSPNEELRKAASEAVALIKDFWVEVYQRRDLYLLIDAVHQKAENISIESQRLLSKRLWKYKRNGMGLGESERARLKEIKSEMGKLESQYSQNISAFKGPDVWLLLKDFESIPPKDYEDLERGTGEREGQILVPSERQDLIWEIKSSCSNAETRKRVSWETATGVPENVTIFKQVVLLHDEYARLLGYDNYAQLNIADKMAKNPETVYECLGTLKDIVSKRAKKELEALVELKRADLDARGLEDDGKFYTWDLDYYEKMLIKRDFSFDSSQIKEYFPLESTVAAMLEIFETVFGMKFRSLSPEDVPTEDGTTATWEENVKIFSVWNGGYGAGSDFLGYLYLDLVKRGGSDGAFCACLVRVML